MAKTNNSKEELKQKIISASGKAKELLIEIWKRKFPGEKVP